MGQWHHPLLLVPFVQAHPVLYSSTDGTIVTRRQPMQALWSYFRRASELFEWQEPQSDSRLQRAMTTQADRDGAINEKPLRGRRAENLSHIMHSSFGLDHYPKYLQRWDIPSIEALENRLEKQLAFVREQKALWLQREAASTGFTQSLSSLPPEEVFDERFLKIFDAAGKLRLSQLGNLLEEECDGCYSFPLLRPDFCQRLLESAESFADYVKQQGVAETMGSERPLVLDRMHLAWLNDMLLDKCVNPVSQAVFPDELNEGILDWRHGYIVSYFASPTDSDNTDVTNPKTRLVRHTDDSEMTLNVCLANDYDGGELALYGKRGTGLEETKLADFKSPSPGWALLHPGRQLHEVLQVKNGNRFGLILWTRSNNDVRGGICPCCWMNGRDTVMDCCVCGPRWN